MAENRLPNYDTFKQLYDFYTTEGRLNPMQAAGMLGNIYAESRGNPNAINAGDGADGTDSIGILQANSTRASALRNFASQREENANDFLTQARYHMYEGTVGPERNNFQSAIQGDSAGQIGTQIASKFIRPAAQHIPQRAGYSEMMYDIFANGNPDGYEAGLSFSPQQGEDLSRQAGGNLSFGDDMPAMDERTGEAVGRPQGASLIGQQMISAAQERSGISALTDGPQPPMAGPLAAIAEALSGGGDLSSLLGDAEDRAVSTTSPKLGGDGKDYGGEPEYGGDGNEPNPQPAYGGELEYGGDGNEPNPDYDTMLNEAFPSAEGELSTVEEFAYTMAPIAEASAYSLGVPVDDAPVTPSGIREAMTAPEPAADDDSEEANRKRRRRLLAADMLQTLSVGLGQMSTGSTVALGDVIGSQQDRRMERAQLDQEQQAEQVAKQQMRRQQGVLAQQFSDMGMSGMAEIAMSGEEGFGEALSTMGQIKGREPSKLSTLERLSREDRIAAMMAVGVPASTASAVADHPDLAYDMMKEYAMPDDGDEEDVARAAEGSALLDASIPFMADPIVRAAATRLGANPQSTEAMTALQSAIKDAGGELPEPPMSEGLVHAFARAAGRSADDPLVQEALAGDPAAQAMLQEAAGKGAERLAETAADENVDAEAAAADAQALVDAGSLSPEEGKLVERLGPEAGMVQVRANRAAALNADEGAAVNRTAVAVAETFIANATTTGAQRSGLRSLFANVKTEAGLANAIRVAEDQYGLTEQVKTALAANASPVIRAALIDLARAQSGATPAIQAAAESRFANLEERSNTLAANIDTASPLVSAMEDVVARVTAPDYDRYSGGPFDSTLAFGQNILDQVIGDGASGLLMAPDQVFGSRQMESQIGQYFAQFRATGSGASSDMESKNFMRAMPNVGDNALKQAGLAQRIIRAQEMVNIELAARREFAIEHIDDPQMLGDQTALEAAIDEALEGSNRDTFPELNQGTEGYMGILADDIRSGNIEPTTVIRVAGPDGEPYYGFADEVLTKLYGKDRAEALLGGTR